MRITGSLNNKKCFQWKFLCL